MRSTSGVRADEQPPGGEPDKYAVYWMSAMETSQSNANITASDGETKAPSARTTAAEAGRATAAQQSRGDEA